jgi:hypothetical protein
MNASCCCSPFNQNALVASSLQPGRLNLRVLPSFHRSGTACCRQAALKAAARGDREARVPDQWRAGSCLNDDDL